MNLRELLDDLYDMGAYSYPQDPRDPSRLLQQLSRFNVPGQLLIRLQGYLVLVPRNEKAEDFLNLLEADYNLPYTPTWRNEEGRKLRLYEIPPQFDDSVSFNLTFQGIDLEVKMGPNDFIPIPEFRGGQPGSTLPGNWLPFRSPLYLDPVILPPATLNVLFNLLIQRT